MSNEEKIREILISHGIDLAGPIVKDDSDEMRSYAFIRATQDSAGKRIPSNFRLKQISDSLLEQNMHVSFIVTDNNIGSIEETIKSALMVSFPDLIRNAFISSPNRGALIWVEPKRFLSEADEAGIRKKCIDLLKVLGHSLDEVRFTSTENTPTRTVCLKCIRQNAPISKDKLAEALTNEGFHIPGGEWLPRMLDSLRKAGLVMRRKDGGFVLTYIALLNLGTTKGSGSPDIERALDLARRHH